MFNKIIKASDGTVLALTEDVTYIKKADNGCYILCPEPDASGISYAGTPYQLLDRDPMGDDLESVMLEPTDIGGWIMQRQRGCAMPRGTTPAPPTRSSFCRPSAGAAPGMQTVQPRRCSSGCWG